MPRIARLVVPGLPHHITQRGSRKQQTFFCDGDYRNYLRLLRSRLADAGVQVWAYCLMPNHVHLAAVPSESDSLAALFRVVHKSYASSINARNGWQGHLWQERFHSFVMDEAHLLAAVRYIELNPVRARLCQSAVDWPWSSARAHLGSSSDPVLSFPAVLAQIKDWSAFLLEVPNRQTMEKFREHAKSGIPMGDESFVAGLEARFGRALRVKKRGRKPGNLEFGDSHQ